MSNYTKEVEDIRKYSREMVREWDVLKGVFRESECTYSQGHALHEINQHRILNLAELANLLLLDKSTSSRLVKGIVNKGWVQWTSHQADSRQKLFSLTDEGKRVVQRNDRLANELTGSALALLEEEEREVVKKGLQLYSKALNQSRRQGDFVIRFLEKEDNKTVARLVREVMTEFNAIGEGYSSSDPELDNMYETYAGDRAAFYVISRNGEILGCGGIAPLKGGSPEVCELQKMYFRPELRGLGLGKKLLRECLQHAQSLGYRQCYLETLDRMWQASILYQKMGFRSLSQSMGNTGHCSCDNWYLKDL